MIQKLCTVAGCDKKTHSRDLCIKHYTRLQRYGSATAPLKVSPWRNLSRMPT